MPIWAVILEVLLWVLFPVCAYWWVRMWLAFSKFNRIYDLTEDAHSFGRIDELRAMNLEIARVCKRFTATVVIYLIVAASFAYLWAIPHAEGLL